jgi:hypothetical protein
MLQRCLLRGLLGVQPDVRLFWSEFYVAYLESSQPNVCHYWAVLYAENLESSLMSAAAGLSSTRQTWSPAWCPPLLGCPLRDNLGVQPDVRHYWAVLYATDLESIAWCPPLLGCPLRGLLGVQPNVRNCWASFSAAYLESSERDARLCWSDLFSDYLESSLMSATAGLSSTRQTWSQAWCPPLPGCPLRDKLGVQPNVRHCWALLYAANLESSPMSATAGLSSTRQTWSPA